MKGCEHSMLVRKVLIHRADTDAGGLGDTVRGDGASPAAFEEHHGGIEHGRDSHSSALLARLTPANEASLSVLSHNESVKPKCELSLNISATTF